ncbi:FkbM family methyltransferase [Sulfurimonas sp.]|uniref:FkbM family methyltransferase n=1 Tax=Sulfurimonas sp. TaxID=2022749 RepID=UPI00286DBB5E|nr:FkbM family methyltransferase [Sulfurimonas sp.]
MSFISYAQNFEDVILNRALQDVESGFYIDVGANDPIEDSVTKAFYDKGWSGINIEPEEEFYSKLQIDRPNDINLKLAVSSTQKSIQFYVSQIRGWSTTDKNITQDTSRDYLLSETRTVEAKSLDEICSQNSVKEIHFLKIDVEGAEKDVLQSFSFALKPWIVVVEATLPNSNIDASSSWEYILINNNYTFVYFDGINKFYLSSQKQELQKYFAYPPNVLDDFIIYPFYETMQQNEILDKKAKQLDELITQLLDEQIFLKEELHYYKSQYNMVVNSRSWKITKPLRELTQALKAILGKKSHDVEQTNNSYLSQEAKDIYKNLKK